MSYVTDHMGIKSSINIFRTWSSRDLNLGLETSRDPFLQVLVSVSVLVLGLGTMDTRSSSLTKREIETK